MRPAPYCIDCNALHTRSCAAQERINRALDVLGFIILMAAFAIVGVAIGAML